MNRFVPCPLLICSLVVIFLSLSGVSLAVEFQVTPSFAVREEYTDNIGYGVLEKDGGFISTMSPGLEFRRKTELIDAYLSARADALNYSGDKYDQRDTIDHFYTGGVSYRFSDRLYSNIDLQYTRDSRTDRDEDDTGLFFINASPRERQRYSLSNNFIVSPKTSTALSYNYISDQYEEDRFVGYKGHVVNLGMSSDLSRFIDNFTGQGNLGYNLYNYPGFRVDNFSFTLGTDWRYSETVTLSFNAGPRYSRSEFDSNELLFGLPTGRGSTMVNDGWGVKGGLTLSYDGLYTTWKVSLSQDVDQSSGRNGATERTKAVVDYGRHIAENFRLALLLNYYWNRSKPGEFAIIELDYRTWRVSPYFVYRFSRNFDLKVSVNYSLTEDRSRDYRIERNTVFLFLRYKFPLFD